MNVHAGDGEVMMRMESAGQPLGQRACLMIVDIAKNAHAGQRVIGGGPFQRPSADQVPDRL